MLKFLIIMGLILYLIYKIGTLFFKAGAASQQYRNFNRSSQNPNVDPRAAQPKKEQKYKGGEYIDYEEIK